MWMDYGRPKEAITIDAYAEAVAGKAHEAYRTIAYRDRVPLAMAETRLTLGRRVPDEQRLDWARSIVAAMGDRRAEDPAGGLRHARPSTCTTSPAAS